MNDQTLNLIQALATKLGTTTEYLWHVLVHAQVVGGIEDLVYAFFWLILMIGCGATYYAIGKNQKNLAVSNLEIQMLLFSGACLFFIFFLIETPSGIDALLRPEYFALQEILRKVK
jgi:hypothetical protein